jgi:hypothetical protein
MIKNSNEHSKKPVGFSIPAPSGLTAKLYADLEPNRPEGDTTLSTFGSNDIAGSADLRPHHISLSEEALATIRASKEDL